MSGFHYPMYSHYLPPAPTRTLTGESRFSDASTTKGGPEADEDTPFTPKSGGRTLTTSHRKLVFTDPVAARYLEEDECTIVVDRRRRLEGYEIYVVEQWACSRIHPTFIICTHTGDTSRSILVNVLAVPNDPDSWSRRLKVYFEAVSQSYAREKETPFGTILVTNLSGFPSALTVIAVPDGDVRKHREDFIVNENLKRMGCTGRAALSLAFPPSSTVNKFHHLYHTSERVPLYSSVMEIVRFCQTALVLYGKLQPTYADGLLCDITERAITEWWNDIGTDFHNVEPSDGIFGPTTVAALIGLTVGAYNRLKETGAPLGKDPMDLSSMKRAVGHFQKSVKLEKTRRLDRDTLDRLHRVTAKSAADEGSGVTRAIKSTIGELSGKGGEMLARGFGGGREKAGIAEVETLDIDRLAHLVSGPKMKWLWQGKEIKSGTTGTIFGAPTDELNGRVFSTDEQGNFIWTSQESKAIQEESVDQAHGELDRGHLRDLIKVHASRFGEDSDGHALPHNSLLGVPGKGSDQQDDGRKESSARSSVSHHGPALNMALAEADGHKPFDTSSTKPSAKGQASSSRDRPAMGSHREILRGIDHQGRESPTRVMIAQTLEQIRKAMDETAYKDFSANVNVQPPAAQGLRRSQSSFQLRPVMWERRRRLPRHLSFSIVAEPILRRRYAGEHPEAPDDEANTGALAMVRARKLDLVIAQMLHVKTLQIGRGLVPYTTSRVEQIEHLDREAQDRLEELNNAYYRHLEEYQTLQATSADLMGREKAALSEGMRRIDMLGQKLDYELEGLQSRLQEVEEGVSDFERSVAEIEDNVKKLVERDEKQSVSWMQRLLGFWGERTT